jgi:hypothetical protein
MVTKKNFIDITTGMTFHPTSIEYGCHFMHFEGFFFFKKSFPFSCFSPTCWSINNYCVDDYDMIMMSLSKEDAIEIWFFGCTSSGKTPQE